MALKLTVLGAGSWGTALAQVEAEAGNQVLLWDRKPEHLQSISSTRENTRYHPGIELHKNIATEAHLEKALARADVVILGIPSHAIRRTLQNAHKFLKQDAILVSAAKGIETESLKTISQVIGDVAGHDRAAKTFAVLSGPTFAKEVLRGQPAGVTVASKSQETLKILHENCQSPTFRMLTTDDVSGVEIAGALKNVIAIVAGASDGFGYGLNARASLITRGLAEISRIGRAKGAHPLTFQGLAGIGDLILTCTGDLSRNRQVGLQMAQGKTLREIMKSLGQVAEGIRTAKAAYHLARNLNVEAPIIEETYFALYERKPAKDAIRDVVSRIPREERS